MVHFPIVLIMVGFFADVVSLFFTKKESCLSKFGFWLMILGTLAAIAGFLSGEYFTSNFGPETPQGLLKEQHELWAKITMWIMIFATALRVYLVIAKKDKSPLKWVVFVLFAVAAGAVGYTGFMGGSLVFNYMIGI
jgi:uncharacterized membrane protein